MRMPLYQAVRSAVLHDWDPIGVGDLPEAQDEYDGYLPKICELLKSRKSRKEILEYLWWIETERMGLSGNMQATEAFADKLIQITATFGDEKHDK